jgi:uncharacterized membrane protein
MNGVLNLILASITFVGSHFVMSHPLRRPMITIFGTRVFQGIYSLVSLALFYWMIVAFQGVPTGILYWPVGDRLWIAASILTLLASILLVGSFVRNPALPNPKAEELAAKMPGGVFLVTRHPMMWSFALWGVAHILIAPRIEVFILAGSIIFLALAGSKGQDIKKQTTMGVDWEGWMRKTHYFPQLGQLHRIGAANLLGGLLLWLLATWGHNFFGVWGAGIFRWVG